jgi:hypothetical protein
VPFPIEKRNISCEKTSTVDPRVYGSKEAATEEKHRAHRVPYYTADA